MSRSSRNRIAKPRGLGGAVLIEAMIASLVFLIGAMGVMAYLAYGRIGLLREGRSRIAAQAAHSRLEELRTVAYDNLESYAETDTAVQIGGVGGLRDTTITLVDEDADEETDYKQATVNVSWREGDITQEVELVTLFAATQ